MMRPLRLLPAVALLCALLAAGAWALLRLRPGPLVDLAAGALTLLAFLLVVAAGLRRLLAHAAPVQPAAAEEPEATASPADPTAGYPLERPQLHDSDPRLMEILEATLARHGLRYGAFIERRFVVADAGDPAGDGHVDLVSSHVGPRGSTAATMRSLEGMILPQGVAQGPYFAILDLVTPELGLVLVGKHGEPPDEPPRVPAELAPEERGRRLYEHWQWQKLVADECKDAYLRLVS